MIRDQAPNHNLGFGVRSHDVHNLPEETQGPNPEGGVIARKLHDDPVLRFLGTMAVTVVGMKVGGDLVRKGGLRLGMHLEDSAAPLAKRSMATYRRTQKLMDSYQGVARDFIDDNPRRRLFIRGDDKVIRSGTIVNTKGSDGYFMRLEEIKEAKRRGIEPPEMWRIRDSIQQRMISQARRLPYELPAAYVTQRALTDPMFGNERPQGRQVNWYNPADVVTDFVKQSVINTAAMIMPFEAGIGGGQQAWRRFMTYGDEALLAPTQREQSLRTASVGVRAILSRVGHDSATLIQNTVKVSSQSTGAFATAVQESKKGSMSTMEWLFNTRKGMKQANQDMMMEGLARGPRTRKLLTDLFSRQGNDTIYDQLPSHLKGLQTGIRTYQKTYQQIGQGYKALDDMMGGRKNYNDLPLSQITALNRVVADGSQIGELSARLANYAAKNGDFKQGLFYQQAFNDEYQKQLIRKLQNVHGLSNDGAKQFAKQFTIDPVKGVKREIDISNRLRVGGKPVHAAGGSMNDFYNAIYARTAMFNKAGDAQIVAKNLTSTVRNTDKLFGDMDFMKGFDNRALKTWRHIEDKIVPQQAQGLLKRTRLPYEDFKGQLSDTQQSFMVRRSAERLGIPVVDPTTGVALPDDILRRKLRSLNLDPNSTARMKGFLIESGDIAKPWHINGANVFGLKPLEVGVALDRGYFKTGTEPDSSIDDLVGRMRANDPISSAVGSYSLGGVYQTANGKVVDFSSLKRKAYGVGDAVAANFQIPLIHLKPLEALGWSAKRDARQRSILQIVPGLSNQAFLGDANQFGDDAYVWMKSRGTKGKVTKVNHTASGDLESNLLPYEYKLADPDAYKMMGRNLRLGMGESGTAPYVGNDAAKTGLGRFIDRRAGGPRTQQIKRFFNIDDHQPDSLKSYVERFKGRRTDINNPVTMARLIRNGSLETSEGTMRLTADGSVTMNGQTVRSAADVAGGFDTLTKGLRPFSMSPRTVRGLEGDPELSRLFGFRFDELKKTSGIGEGANVYVPISGLDSTAQVVGFARQLRSSIQGDYENLVPDAARTLRRAETSFLSRHLDAATSSSYWDELLPQGARTSTISTRVDQLKTDLYRFLSIREEVAASGSFEQSLPKLMARLDDLKTRGAVTGTEYTEARTALLSMQIDYMNYQTYNAARSSTANRAATMGLLRGDANSQALLDDYLTQNFETSTSAIRDYGRAAIRRNLKPAGYEYDGLSYNPFGNTDTAFVPTFGSAFERSGARAVGSALGWGTWSNPEAFSGASVPVSHIVGRLNRPFQTLGLGTDMTRYNGPLDFYARGVVGQRALPIYAGGVGLLTADRMAGGVVNDKDQNGERVYSPLVFGAIGRGAVEAQAAGSGLTPGGLGYEERKEQLLEGEVGVRQGRYWLLGNTPFMGGKVQYFRASWYRRMMAGPQYTDETFDSPLERLAYGYDFSPLRPLAPYHYEDKTQDTRPYPVTGDYFTGPWGPLSPVLNATVGRVLKPERMMHQEALEEGLRSYAMAGDSGLYQAGGLDPGTELGSGLGSPQFMAAAGQFGTRSSLGSGRFASERGLALGSNAALAGAGITSLESAATSTRATIGAMNQQLIASAGIPGSVRPEIIPNMDPTTRGGLTHQASEFGYRAQEMAGIYGFAFGATRDYLGLGSQDLSPQRPVLQSGAYAFGSSRGFWDMNIGGLGDLPTPFEGQFGNLEFSEVARRFIPKERPDVNYINPIKNQMGEMYPWLPGAGNIKDFTRGDPYSQVQEGEIRLPGTTYERLNPLNSDSYGRYGLVDQHKILGDVSPYSAQYRELDRLVDQEPLTPTQQQRIETTRAQVAAKSKKYNFTPYEYRYADADDYDMGRLEFSTRKAVERVQHAGTYFNTKFVNHNTAVEDWERNHVYGATFPSWSHPIQDFINPLIQQNAQRTPLLAGLALGGVGGMFGATPGARAVGGTIGALVGLGASGYTHIKQAITGDRHIPENRMKEMAVEEQTDILSYVKYKKLEEEAQRIGDSMMAQQYEKQSRMTMYGVDLQNLDPLELVNAVPKRKREHFLEMLQAPEQERARILSTAPRLERRIYQAAWGYKVENRPELEGYFQQHELPASTSSVWHPQTSMTDVEIKVAQSLGLDLAQMGYYPQQISEANLLNPEYPDYNRGSSEREIREFFRQNNIDADITPIRAPGGNGAITMYSGV